VAELIPYTYEQFNEGLNTLVEQIKSDEWQPDYIVGITRGGLVPAVRLSHMLGIPMETVKWSLRDDCQKESNCWIPEDIDAGMKVLIVDDIVDAGETVRTLIEDWQSSIFNRLSLDNIRICAMIVNTAQETKVHYSHIQIDRNVEPRWFDFWWETK
jgi:hypoxanthine phosphoribosyltransferase